MIAALAALAFAGDLPNPPEVPEPTPRECAEVIALVPGNPPPPGLIVDGVIACGAVAVPTSEFAYLLDMETDAEHVRTLYALKVGSLERDLSFYVARVEELEKPPPWHQTPTSMRWWGRLEGIGTIVLAGVLFSQLD